MMTTREFVTASIFISCTLTAQDLGSSRANNAAKVLENAKTAAKRVFATENRRFDSARKHLLARLKSCLELELDVSRATVALKKDCVNTLGEAKSKARLTGPQHDKIVDQILILRAEILAHNAWIQALKARSSASADASVQLPLFNSGGEPQPSKRSFRLPSQAQKVADAHERAIKKARKPLLAARKSYQDAERRFLVAKGRLAKEQLVVLDGLLEAMKKCLEQFDRARRQKGRGADHDQLKVLIKALEGDIVDQEAERTRLRGEIASLVETRGRVVDLMGLVDLKLDPVDPADQTWSWKDAGSGARHLHTRGRADSRTFRRRIQLPYQPPQEYDFEMVFIPEVARAEIGQIFLAVGTPTMWMILSGKGAGFQHVDGKYATISPAFVKGLRLVVGEENKSTIRVRKSGIQALVNGVLISEFTDPTRMSLTRVWGLPNKSLGIGANHSVRFVSIRVTEVNGKGKLLR